MARSFFLLIALLLLAPLARAADTTAWPRDVLLSYKKARSFSELIRCREGETEESCAHYQNLISGFASTRLPQLEVMNPSMIQLRSGSRFMRLERMAKPGEYRINARLVTIDHRTTPEELHQQIQAVLPRKTASVMDLLVPRAEADGDDWAKLAAAAQDLVRKAQGADTCEKIEEWAKACIDMASKADQKHSGDIAHDKNFAREKLALLAKDLSIEQKKKNLEILRARYSDRNKRSDYQSVDAMDARYKADELVAIAERLRPADMKSASAKQCKAQAQKTVRSCRDLLESQLDEKMLLTMTDSLHGRDALQQAIGLLQADVERMEKAGGAKPAGRAKSSSGSRVQ